jgi:predicted transcriptional regulator
MSTKFLARMIFFIFSLAYTAFIFKLDLPSKYPMILPSFAVVGFLFGYMIYDEGR